jgi:SRSO17 transposase
MHSNTDAGRARLESFLDDIGALLRDKRRKASFATYARGLLAEGERKSVEPIAARACPDVRKVDAAHQRLLHLLADSEWDDHRVRLAATRYALRFLTANESVEACVIDDTGFLKQGTHSVGVQRQYTGSAGKVANSQVATSLSLLTRSDHLPIDFELYLPESWVEDTARHKAARIPADVTFKTKPELALELLARAKADGLPLGVVLADSAYGNSGDFRAGIHQLGLQYSVGVASSTKVFEVKDVVNRGGPAVDLLSLARKLEAKGKFQHFSWRTGTKDNLSARFAMRRVCPCAEQDVPLEGRSTVWLLIEWRDGEAQPSNYYLSSLPDTTSLDVLVSISLQRWRTERAYEDLKGELGLDHYEGRNLRGWHHHISVVLCCYAFVVAERHRIFPLPSKRPHRSRPFHCAA